MSLKRIVPLALALSAGVLLFQNCGRMSAQSNGSSLESPEHYGGNGSGYDGKVFVHLKEGPVCADGSLFDARLEGRGGGIFLARDNCANIPLALQMAVQVDTNPLSPAIVIYAGRVYHERILLIDDSAAGSDNSRLLGGNGFTVDANGALNGSVGILAKYKADGSPLWMKTGPELNGAFKNLSSLPSGGFALVTTRLDSTGGVFKLDAAGAPVWAKALAHNTGFTSGFWFSSVASDAGENIYLAGGLEDASSKSSAAFILKLDPSGNLSWVRTILPLSTLTPGPAPHSQSSAVTYVSAGAVFLKGNLKGVPFVARFNDAGDFYWVKAFAGYKPGFGAIHRTNGTTLISLNDTASSLLVEMDGLGNATGAKRLTPPAGFTAAFIGNLILSADGSTTATGYVGNSTQRAGIVLTRAADESPKSQWQFTVGGYSPIEFPKIGPDGIIWGEAHVPFAGGGLLTAIMVRWDPSKPAPVCAFCSVPSLPLNAETAPAPVDNNNVYIDQFLTVTGAALPVFSDVPAGTFAF